MQSIDIIGYEKCREIATGLNCKIIKAKRVSDNKDVALKIAKTTPPSSEQIVIIEHEWQIAETLKNSASTPTFYTLSSYRGSPFIEMEFIPYPTVASILKKKKIFFVDEFLHFALAALTALENIHRYDIIHKDFNIFNLLYDEEKCDCKVIDFGLSVAINHQRVIPIDPSFIEGTLPYLSPEQTGRMNRGIDYRTDYYSLGITFYQAICGELPFFSKDPLELVHSHIAEIPQPPTDILSSIPDVVSSIILKLIAKEPEERYQSIAGIRGDLVDCLARLREGKITPFPIATQDTYERFEIPQKIYGRENEIKHLLSIYEKVMNGHHGLVMIGGAPGVGKTSLVNEMYKPISAKEGAIFSGKFEQFKRSTPYFAITQALEEFMQVVMAKPQIEFALFRKKLLDALGSNGQLIIDIVPSVEKIIGKQDPLPKVGMLEAQNRFVYYFREFMQCLPTQEKPLVLFFDDLQTADTPSLKLIEILIESAIPYLLIVGGYRNNEVDESHPLALMLGDLQKREITFEMIHIDPLKLTAAEELIADALHKPAEQVHPLAKLCYNKSGGNPFFLLQLLHTFYQNGWIDYDWDQASWQWDLEKIRSAPHSDNVAELMIDKISSLPPLLTELITTASCIGNRFSFDELQLLVKEKSKELLRKNIEALIKEELIIAEERRYYVATNFRFAHDRIQEAAHELLSEEREVELHYTIARYLEAKREESKKKSDDQLFTIANHYNIALEIKRAFEKLSSKEKEAISKLNISAAKVAIDSAAYDAALDYCEKSLAWLDKGDWKKNYPQLIELHLLAMESAYLSDQYERMKEYNNNILANSKNIIDSYKSYCIIGQYYFSNVEYLKATEIFLRASNEMGYPLPGNPSIISVAIEIIKALITRTITGFTIEKLDELPLMKDRHSQAFLELINDLISGLYLSGNINLFSLAICRGTRLVYRKGNHPKVVAIYSAFAIILQQLGALKSSYRYGKLTLALCDTISDPKSRTTGIFTARCFILIWKEKLHEQSKALLKNYSEAVEAGNMQFAAYSLICSLRYGFFADTSVFESIQKVESFHKPLQRLKHPDIVVANTYFYRMLLELSSSGARGLTSSYEGIEMNASTKGVIIGFETIIGFILRDFSRAFSAIAEHPKYKQATVGIYDEAVFTFYKSLVFLATYASKPFLERLSSRIAIEGGIAKLKKYAKENPENFLNKQLILQAEWARVRGKKSVAEKLYAEAMQSSNNNAFPFELAVANELTARFYLLESDKMRGKLYLTEAVRLFQTQGANAKVEQLQQEFYEVIFGKIEKGETKGTQVIKPALYAETIKIGAKNIDIGSMQKASELITSTIQLEKLLKRLMGLVMEQAGADRGLLLFQKDNEFYVQAERTKKSEETQLLVNTKSTEKMLPLSLLQQSARNAEMIIVDDATQHSRFKDEPYIVERGVKSILCMPLMHHEHIAAMLYLENKLTKKAFTKERYTPLQFLSAQLAMAIDNSRLYEGTMALNDKLSALNLSYERFVPKDFISLIGKESVIDLLPGEFKEQEMSILFMDIRSFTSLSESMTPRENFCFINEFIGYMEPVIRINRGFIDKYIGDAIMALFPKSADDAVICAFEMVEALSKYNVIRKRRGDKEIQIGIGVNTGKLILGTVGNKQRMDGTVISDAVNVASRVEHLTKDYGKPILFTENSYNQLVEAKKYQILLVGETPIRGKKEAMTLYTILDKKTTQ